ncbi:MAG TPA: gephyrin-like molybdotransferase Glp [Acidimicrobiia bacterium]|jgi:molybdenum cofactor synthesis domain-containing protein
MPLIPLADVQAAIFGAVTRLEPVEVDLRDALGLVLAQQVTAPEAVPPFPNTAMDGYAVRAADTAGAAVGAPVRLRVIGELAAGHAPTVAVGDGEAIRIMTGAPMPDSADAIVMVERTTREGDDGVLVTLAVEPGLHVRGAGGDLEAGDVVFEPGTVLTAARVGVLATVGARRVRAHPRVRVGVLSTGDELVDDSVQAGPLEPGKIRDSNRPMLLAQLADAGAEPLDLGSAHDDADVMTRTLADAVAQCDAVITSGGVSVGDFDYVSDALERIAGDDTTGASRVDWYQVAIKPAKPLCIGMLHGTPVFGLPGNPVSSFVSFELFARPALQMMMGHDRPFRREVLATAGSPLRRRVDGKLHLDRVVVDVVDGAFVATGVRSQESNALASSAAANGFALLPDGEGVDTGDPVTVMLLD